MVLTFLSASFVTVKVTHSICYSIFALEIPFLVLKIFITLTFKTTCMNPVNFISILSISSVCVIQKTSKLLYVITSGFNNFKGFISWKRIKSLHFLITFTKYIPIRMLLMWLVLDVSQICQYTFPLVLVDTLLNMFIIYIVMFCENVLNGLRPWLMKKVECAAMSLIVLDHVSGLHRGTWVFSKLH